MRSAAKLVVLVGILGGLLGCREEAAPVADNSEAPARLVLSMEVHPVTRDGALFTGVVAARTESELGFRVAGEVIERRVDPGDRVKRGDVLLVLDVDDFELALRAARQRVRSAEASVRQLQNDEQRYRQLADNGAVSRQAYDQLATELRVAEANLASARADAAQVENRRGYSTLTADADGVITEVLADQGQVVAAGQVVAQLAHSGAREAVISIPETQRALADSPAQAFLFGQPDTPIGATLRELSAVADPVTRTYRARYVLDTTGEPLPIGSTVSIRLQDSQSTPQLQVPLGALLDQGAGTGVWVIDADNRVRFTPVEVARLGQEFAVIGGGLEDGQRVVALGAHLLHEGDAVKPLPEGQLAGTETARSL
ncbi:MAG: efflux transporter periplasmic adaptor subunit [Pseudomonadales bacterium]|jgi:RND family efflux transporter MFP subunit|uniref:efflux RND transporter periplasmic adaptor subunit n=1 Tax=Halopseudomonas aestusnigri TaxID=857252 RepID=UPI000C546AE9|nr:efflux transporter periplasmic adaptor subunit [Pseudomonadales bacterium]|tara:strand:+ start:471 stop:1583 length:1113 start_codon:yes stop_codon:yes gene_type:complete